MQRDINDVAVIFGLKRQLLDGISHLMVTYSRLDEVDDQNQLFIFEKLGKKEICILLVFCWAGTSFKAHVIYQTN